MDMFAKSRGSWQDGGARGPQTTQSVKLKGLPHGAQSEEALAKMRTAAGDDPNAPKTQGKDDKDKSKKDGQGNSEQGKDINGVTGTTAAAPPTKKNTADGLNNNAEAAAAKTAATAATAAAAAAGIGAAMASTQAADADKKNATGTPDPAAAAVDAAAMASRTGIDTDGAKDKQQPPQQNLTGTELQDEKNKKENAASSATNPQNLNVTGAVNSDKKDGTSTAEKKDGTVAPDKKEIASATLPAGDPAKQTKDDKTAAGLDAVGKNGPPLNVASNGSESTTDKKVNKMEADQVNENLQTATTGENETQVKVNQLDKSGVSKNQDGSKLSFEPGDQTDQRRLQDTAAGLGNQPIVPPPSGANSAAGARQNQSPEASAGKTLNAASTTAESQEPAPKLLGQMENGADVFDTGYKVDGNILMGVKDQDGNLRPIARGADGSALVFSDSPGAFAQKAADIGHKVERAVAGKRPGGMARSSDPSVSGAHFSLGESAATAADSGNPDMLTDHVNEALQDTPGPTKIDPFKAMDHANYNTVDPHLMARDIRTYAGPSMGKSADGQPTIVGGVKGVSHVRFPDDATQEQKAILVAAAGYANSMTNDAEAFDAARQSAIDSGADQPRGFADRVAANWMQYRGGSWKETYRAKRQFQQAMFQEAVQGSAAYITGDESDSNAFTQHLTTRFGSLGPEKQAWLLHTLTDNTSPESGFGTARMPATDALVQANMGIDAYNRAAMGRVLGTNIPVWQRPIAAKGIANYMKGVVDQRFGKGQGSDEERAAAAGGMTGKMSLAMVEACATIQQFDPTPETTLANPEFVRTIAARGVRYRSDDSSPNPMKQAYDEEVNERKGPQHTRTSSSFTGGSTWGGSGMRNNTQYVDVPARPVDQSGESQVSPEGGLGPIDLGPSQQENISFQFSASPRFSASGHNLSSRLNSTSPLPQAIIQSTNVQAGGSAAQTNSSAHSYEILYEAGDTGIADIEKLAVQASNVAPPAMPNNVDIYVKMQQAGFTAAQRRDPNVVAAAKEVYALSNGDSQMMSITAVAAHSLGNNTAALDVQTVETVQTMLESGWRPNNISSHDIHIAQMIMEHNSNTGSDPSSSFGPPGPQQVRIVATHPQFRAAPPLGRGMTYEQMHRSNAAVIKQLAQSRQEQSTQQGGSDATNVRS